MKTLQYFAAVSLCFGAAACAGDAGEPGADGGGGANGNGDGDRADAGAGGGELAVPVQDVFTATEAGLDLPGGLAALSVDAALEASRLAGADAFTGTVTQQSADSYTYSPEPNDRLRLELSDGRTWEFTFRALQGDFTGDGERYVSEPHNLDMDVTSNEAAGDLDLVITSQPVDGAQVGGIAGGLTEEGIRWNLDLSFEFSSRAEVGPGNEYETVQTLQGSASADSLGVSVAVDRYYRYVLINNVENVDHRMEHALTWNGRSLALAGRVFVGFRDSQPVDKDQWVIEGALVEDGVPVRSFVAEEDPTGLTVWLGSGADRIKLFFFSYL